MLKIVLFVILQLFAVFNCQTLPKSIRKCHFDESNCIVKSMNDAIKQYARGIPEVGLKPLDVVEIQDSDVWNEFTHAGNWLKFKLSNQFNYGFENTTITKVKGFGKEPTSKLMEIHGRIPSLIHKGDYIAHGKFWFLQINAKGQSLSDFQHFRFILKLKVIVEYRNNKRYLKIYELTPVVNLNRWILGLEHIFYENTDLTLAVNNVFNTNWLQFWNELEPAIIKIFKGVFLGMIKDVFENVSYDDMFLNDGY